MLGGVLALAVGILLQQIQFDPSTGSLRGSSDAPAHVFPTSKNGKSDVTWPSWVRDATENCGVAALLALMQLEDRVVDEAVLRANIPISNNGASLRDLSLAAKQQGVNAEVMRVSIWSLRHRHLPCIALLSDDTDRPNHFVVVFKVDRNLAAKVLDATSHSILDLNPGDFKKQFTGFILTTHSQKARDYATMLLGVTVGVETISLISLVLYRYVCC